MSTVTLDTILVERPDVATLIDEAHQKGWDVAVVEVRQSDVDPQCFCGRYELEGDISCWETYSRIDIRLHRIAGSHDSSQMAEYSRCEQVGTLGIWWYDFGFDTPLQLDSGRQRIEILHTWNDPEPILHIISRGASAEQSFWTPLAPVQTRQVRAAIVLLAHAAARRDIFVTDNTHAFVRHGRRQALE